MPRRLAALAVVLLAAALAAPSAKAAELYLSGNLIQSVGQDDATGTISGGLQIQGADGDSSLGYGIAPGFGFKFAEVLPEGWRAWDSAFRIEAEFTYGREYEVVSDLDPSPGYKFFNEVKVWTAMPVVWFDLPLRKPLSRTFGRVPLLDPLTFSVGFGAGVSHVHIDAFDNISRGRDSVYKFSWQANAALSYDLTDRTALQFGYRYLDFGATDADMFLLGTNVPSGTIDLDVSAHEFSFVLRWAYFERPLESFSPENWRIWRRDEPDKPRKKWRRPRWLGGPKGP